VGTISTFNVVIALAAEDIYEQGYNDAQHDLFRFIVALGVVCVIGGVVVGMCV